MRQILQNAHNEQILLYEPRKEKPQLTFVRERVAAENLTIDFERFNFRKERAIQRTEQSIRYAEMRRCRSQMLLAYFSETDAHPCGICDVCTGRNTSEVSAEVFETYAAKIREVLRPEPLPFGEVLSAFALKRHEAVSQVLGYLLDEGKVGENEEGKLVWRGG